MVNKAAWESLLNELSPKGVILVAVSKTKPVGDIEELYQLGQRDFGENYVQELVDKQQVLPSDIHWHFIGHLQTNKVKYIAPFVHLIHTVDSFKLLLEINKQAARYNRSIDVLLQMHVAEEETKFGMDEKEIFEFLDYYHAQKAEINNVRICGLMGMATNTDNEKQIHAEFFRIYNVFKHLKHTTFVDKPSFAICSIGMSADYKIAVEEGGNMVRVGSMLFGNRY